MTPAELAAALDTLGWSARHLARLLGCSAALPRLWLGGKLAVPDRVAVWLERLAEAHQLEPPPNIWRTLSQEKDCA